MKLSLGLCKNKCVTTMVLSRYFMKLAKKTHLHCVQGIWVCPFPTPVPALKPGCTPDNRGCVPRAPWGGGSPVNSSRPFSRPPAHEHKRGEVAKVIRSWLEQTRSPPCAPCPRGCGWGVRATGLGDGPSALGAGHSFMSQLFGEWPV